MPLPNVHIYQINYNIASQVFQKVLNAFFPKGTSLKKVCIKINLCDYRMAESGATTDPVLLGALIETIKTRFNPLEITILENDATSVEADSLFSLLGFREMVNNYNAKLINISKGEWIRKRVAKGKIFKEIEVPLIWELSDLKINFAKLKTNMLTKTTGCLKNMFGLIRNKKKSVYHHKINDVIADINTVLKADLCLVDGMIGQEGKGPAFGRPKHCGLLITGTDPVAVDSCCARIMGFNPILIGHLRKCWLRGLGSIIYKMSTDIPKFSYKAYRFKFSRIEYLVRSFLRNFIHL